MINRCERPHRPVALHAPGRIEHEIVDQGADGRILKVTKVKVNGMTYPRIIFQALQGSKVSLKYDNGNESYEAESPMQYEIKDFQNNNAYVTVTVDEGGPAKTWHVKLQNANGYDLKIEDQ